MDMFFFLSKYLWDYCWSACYCFFFTSYEMNIRDTASNNAAQILIWKHSHPRILKL